MFPNIINSRPPLKAAANFKGQKMKTGISTASYFLRELNEDAVKLISKTNAQVCEVFLASYSEYNQEFANKVLKSKGDLEVHSIHSVTTQFEPQLYSDHPRAKKDAFSLLDGFLAAGKTLGAKYYTFHGVTRLKKSESVTDFAVYGKKTREIMESCQKYNITLSYENVHWAYYSYPSFFKQLKDYCPQLKGTLDIKQAMQSGFNYRDYLDDMAGEIVTVHLSDYDNSGKTMLPGRGSFDFLDLFRQLKDVGFDGAAIIEVYKNDYGNYDEIKNSLDYINEIKYRVF